MGPVHNDWKTGELVLCFTQKWGGFSSGVRSRKYPSSYWHFSILTSQAALPITSYVLNEAYFLGVSKLWTPSMRYDSYRASYYADAVHISVARRRVSSVFPPTVGAKFGATCTCVRIKSTQRAKWDDSVCIHLTSVRWDPGHFPLNSKQFLKSHSA
jgi:hypothetical protein